MNTFENAATAAISGISSSDAVLRAVLETAREGVLIVDSTMRISAANSAAAASFAWQDGTLIGKRLSEVIRNAELHLAFQNAVHRGIADDLKFELADATRFDVHLAPISIDGSGFAIGVFYDVTHIERLEKVRQEFLSNISHELRTPLAAVMAFVETLEDGAIDDKENNRRFLGVIRRNTERMHALISDILELSLIESGNVPIDKKPIDFFKHVQEIFTSLSANASAGGITLVNNVSPGELVLADPVRLDQILTNLIDNAVKFNRPNGSVTVAAGRLSGVFVLTVADTGEGISGEHLHRIFERFYRADRGRTREIGGTGLGLAIVKHLARLHGGEVFVRSELGRGTVFSVQLPVK